jgi:hypothetical protein
METEIKSLLRGVSSDQPQLFAEIAQCHDLHALPEHSMKFPLLSAALCSMSKNSTIK